MNKIVLFTLGLACVAAFTISAPAQPGTAAAAAAIAPGKVVWLDSGAFSDETGGIKRYVAAQGSIETEMKPKTDELNTIRTRLQTLQTEIENLQKQATSNPAVNQQALAKQIQDKTDEGQTLQRDFEYKQKAAQAYYGKRAGEVLNPISLQIMTALKDYSKQKGFTVVLDIAVMAGDQQTPGSILYLDPTADVTKDFITYFNAKPATTATATRPQ